MTFWETLIIALGWFVCFLLKKKWQAWFEWTFGQLSFSETVTELYMSIFGWVQLQRWRRFEASVFTFSVLLLRLCIKDGHNFRAAFFLTTSRGRICAAWLHRRRWEEKTARETLFTWSRSLFCFFKTLVKQLLLISYSAR